MTGPTSDHLSGGLVACPLKRWKVVIPVFGFCRTSSIGVGGEHDDVRLRGSETTEQKYDG